MAMSKEKLKQLFKSYESIGVLGRGHFGTVFLLRSPETGDMVVSKQIRVEGISADEMQKVENERRILERLQHEHVISFFCSWFESEELHGACVLNLVMEYAEGGTLGEQISSRAAAQSPFPTSLVHRWTSQLCSALQHVHSQWVLHRDLKTHNVFLTSSGDLKLGDFGISKANYRHRVLPFAPTRLLACVS